MHTNVPTNLSPSVLNVNCLLPSSAVNCLLPPSAGFERAENPDRPRVHPRTATGDAPGGLRVGFDVRTLTLALTQVQNYENRMEVYYRKIETDSVLAGILGWHLHWHS